MSLQIQAAVKANRVSPVIKKIVVRGKTHYFSTMPCFESMADVGWVWITSIGEENLYFNFQTDDGQTLAGYCKCL
jgi:hypothetical protein